MCMTTVPPYLCITPNQTPLSEVSNMIKAHMLLCVGFLDLNMCS